MSSIEDTRRVVVCPVDELPPGARKIVVPFRGRAGIGVFNVHGTYHALRNLCPHKSGPLCTGRIGPLIVADAPPTAADANLDLIREGEIIRCPRHMWEFEIATGRCLVDPKACVKTYPVVVEAGQVVVYADPDLSLRKLCAALGAGRTYWYTRPSADANAERETSLRSAIERIVLAFPGYGYQRVTKALKREPWEINHKRVLRVMREESLLCQLERRFVRTTDSAPAWRTYPNLLADIVPDRPDQGWVADITYIASQHCVSLVSAGTTGRPTIAMLATVLRLLCLPEGGTGKRPRASSLCLRSSHARVQALQFRTDLICHTETHKMRLRLRLLYWG